MLYLICFTFIFLSTLFADFSDLIPGFNYQNIQLSRYGKNIELDIFTINPDSVNIDIINLPKNKTVKEVVIDKNKEDYFLVCNAGMFNIDYRTNMGYMKSKGRILNAKEHPNYYSVMAFDPLYSDLPNFYIYDTDITHLDSILSKYDSVIENLRLIKRDAENRWSQQNKKWSELAIAQDIKGNIVIVYCRNKISMFDFNNLILSLPIDLVVAQHLEGNVSAQLYFKINQYELDYDNNEYVPNLIGFKVRKF